MKTIAVGLTPGHLLEPYDSLFDKKRVEKFHEYLKENNIQKFKSNIDTTDFIFNNYKNLKKINIIGSYADACVAYSIGIALRFQLEVESPEDLIFYCDQNSSLEKSVKQYKNLYDYELKELMLKGEVTRKLDFNYSFNNGIHKFFPK